MKLESSGLFYSNQYNPLYKPQYQGFKFRLSFLAIFKNSKFYIFRNSWSKIMHKKFKAEI